MREHTLIAYFSRADENYDVGYIEKGNTAEIADFIAENVDADIFEIKPVVPYPKEYRPTTEAAQKEFNENALPEFIGEIENIEQYDTIFLGYPIWWGKMPRIMNTFLEKYDLSGKTIITFSTHGGSGWGSSISQLEELCPDSDIIKGFSVAGTNAKNSSQSVKSWIEKLDLK